VEDRPLAVTHIRAVNVEDDDVEDALMMNNDGFGRCTVFQTSVAPLVVKLRPTGGSNVSPFVSAFTRSSFHQCFLLARCVASNKDSVEMVHRMQFTREAANQVFKLQRALQAILCGG